MTHRILFFVSHAAGGVRALWSDIALGLGERGHVVQLAALYPHAEEAVTGAQGVPRWHYIVPHRPASLWARVAMLVRMARWLRRERPDVALTAMPAANVLLPALARLVSPRTRVITSHHSPVETHNRLLDALDSRVGLLKSVRANVSVSGAVQASLTRKPAAYRAKSVVIRNALPRAVAAQIAAAAAARPGRAPGRRAIAVGRLSAQKNYPMLIRAARLAPGVAIDIVGGGTDEAALRQLAEQQGVADRVRFLGQRDRAETLALMADADIFVQASLFEGHSLALIEAATFGLPLIVTDVPAQREALTGEDGTIGGILVPLDDDAALAWAMASVLDDSSLRARLSAAALELARQARFVAMLDRYEALLG